MTIIYFLLCATVLLLLILLIRERKNSCRVNTFLNEPGQSLEEILRSLEKSRQVNQTYTRIGKILSRGWGGEELLELILDECQSTTSADAGTLYLYDKANEQLIFTIMHTNSQGVRQGGTSGNEVKLKPVPLYKDGQPNRNNVCSSCALSGKTINIPDVYEEVEYNFSGTRAYDSKTGYRSHSMLVMPMKDLEGKMLGVIQLINARDKETGKPVSFTRDHENLISLLTAHAASILNNLKLTDQLKDLFNAFIRSIASAIDTKSPYTGDHIRRVVTLTEMITQAVNEAEEGPFKDTRFSYEEMEEIRISAWLHDIGKLTTPDGLVNKSTKLELFEDRIELIGNRFRLIEELAGTEKEKNQIRKDRAFVESCNIPKEFMDDERLTRLKEIAHKTYLFDGETLPYLTEEETEKLSIRKGTLTADERKIIENHVAMTYEILGKLKQYFPENLAMVPEYAAMHHEKLDGTGYHRKLKGKDIPLQARIIAVSDIFEALTARDRPYRQPIEWNRALEIIKEMADSNELDSKLHDLLFSSGVAEKYSLLELKDKSDWEI